MLQNVSFYSCFMLPHCYNPFMENWKTLDGIKHYLASEKLTIKEFAKIIRCTPQHLSGVLSGRIPYAESLQSKIAAEISRRNGGKSDNISHGAEWPKDIYTIKIRFTAYEWGHILAFIPADINIEEKIRDFVLYNLLPDKGRPDKDVLPPQE